MKHLAIRCQMLVLSLSVVLSSMVLAVPYSWRNLPDGSMLLLDYQRTETSGETQIFLNITREDSELHVATVGKVQIRGWSRVNEILKLPRYTAQQVAERQVTLLKTKDKFCVLAEIDPISEQFLYVEMTLPEQGGKLVRAIDLFGLYEKHGVRGSFEIAIPRPGEIEISYPKFELILNNPKLRGMFPPSELTTHAGKPLPVSDVFTFSDDGRLFRNGIPEWNARPTSRFEEGGPGKWVSVIQSDGSLKQVKQPENDLSVTVWEKGFDLLYYNYRMDASGSILGERRRVDTLPAILYRSGVLSVLPVAESGKPSPTAPSELIAPKPMIHHDGLDRLWLSLWIGGGLGSIVVLGWLALRLRR